MFPQEEQSEWLVPLLLGITPHKSNVVMCIDKQGLAHSHIYHRQSEFRSVIYGCYTYATLWKTLFWTITQLRGICGLLISLEMVINRQVAESLIFIYLFILLQHKVCDMGIENPKVWVVKIILCTLFSYKCEHNI